MKKMTAIKMMIIVIVLLFAVMFIIENMDPVSLYFPILRGQRFGLIFIMFASYISGFMTAVLVLKRLAAKMRKKRELEEAINNENEELFSEEE